MVKRYNPYSVIDLSAWIVEDPEGLLVMASDYEALVKERDALAAENAEMLKNGFATAIDIIEIHTLKTRIAALESALREIARGKDSSDYGSDGAAWSRLAAIAAGAFEAETEVE